MVSVVAAGAGTESGKKLKTPDCNPRPTVIALVLSTGDEIGTTAVASVGTMMKLVSAVVRRSVSLPNPIGWNSIAPVLADVDVLDCPAARRATTVSTSVVVSEPVPPPRRRATAGDEDDSLNEVEGAPGRSGSMLERLTAAGVLRYPICAYMVLRAENVVVPLVGAPTSCTAMLRSWT